MKYLLILSGEALQIAKDEVLSVFEIKKYRCIDRIMIIDSNDEIASFHKLAYTKRCYQLLFTCKNAELEEKFRGFDWSAVYRESFCLRMHYLDKMETNFYDAQRLAGYVWRSIPKPVVNLDMPKTKIELYFIRGHVYCGLLLYEQRERFEERKAHKRPALHPISLHPKLARALVNLSGAKKGDTILDPFCGIGGILIEAGLMGYRIIGYDIDKKILDKCKKNLDYFKIKNYKLINKSAINCLKEKDFKKDKDNIRIVTDLPYGKSTKDRELDKLYYDFLCIVKKVFCKKSVIGFPDFIDYKILKSANLKIIGEYNYYIHKSMSKKIIVLGKQI